MLAQVPPLAVAGLTAGHLLSIFNFNRERHALLQESHFTVARLLAISSHGVEWPEFTVQVHHMSHSAVTTPNQTSPPKKMPPPPHPSIAPTTNNCPRAAPWTPTEKGVWGDSPPLSVSKSFYGPFKRKWIASVGNPNMVHTRCDIKCIPSLVCFLCHRDSYRWFGPIVKKKIWQG